MKNIFLLITALMLSSCGFKYMYNKDDATFSNINVICKNKYISKELRHKLGKILVLDNDYNLEITVKTDKNIIASNNNMSASRYVLYLRANYILKNGDKIKKSTASVNDDMIYGGSQLSNHTAEKKTYQNLANLMAYQIRDKIILSLND